MSEEQKEASAVSKSRRPVKRQIAGPHAEVSYSVDLAWAPKLHL